MRFEHMIQHPPFRPGQTVLTADISRLGAVAEVRGPFLRVHRRFRGSFWLAAECILWADHDRVVMAFARADLNRYRRARLPAIPRAGAALCARISRRTSAQIASAADRPTSKCLIAQSDRPVPAASA